MSLKIYLDTSVLSYYTGHPTRDLLLQARQKLTKDWWNQPEVKKTFHVSVYSIVEIENGHPEASLRRLKSILGFPILNTSGAVEKMAQLLWKEMDIPGKSHLDAYHLAIAALNGQDYIVSWNFKHLVNARVKGLYKTLCLNEGLLAPEIRTPEEVMGEKT